MENLIIPNEKELNKKIDIFVKEGVDKIHVISDFDRTLTKAFVGGEKVTSIINFLMYDNCLGSDYSNKAKILLDYYHAIEIDGNIPIQKRKTAMQEWWEKHFELLIQSKLNERDIERVINSNKIRFREGVLNF